MNHLEINRALHRRGVTQASIAAATSTSPSTVWKVLRGRMKTPVVRRYIANSIGRSYSDVWGVEDPGIDRLPTGRRPVGV